MREEDVRHLPLLDQPVAERADAARNRRKILDAAERLLTGPAADADTVPMRAVAAAAGVGVGTLFRRFGNRDGLMNALLEQRAIDLQAAVMSGPPPLGPGTEPGERLCAFLTAVAGYVDRYAPLVGAYERSAPGARYGAPVYRFWHQHARVLIDQARPDLDADLLAHLLLAPLTADLQAHLAATGLDLDRRARAVADLVEAVLR